MTAASSHCIVGSQPQEKQSNGDVSPRKLPKTWEHFYDSSLFLLHVYVFCPDGVSWYLALITPAEGKPSSYKYSLNNVIPDLRGEGVEEGKRRTHSTFD